MKQIIQKPTMNATVAETCDLAKNAGQSIKNSGVDDNFLAAQAVELINTGNKMEVSIAADRSKEFTEALAAADDNRDSGFSAFKLFTRGYIVWKNEEQQKHARKLYDLIKQHGLSLDDMNYEEESGRMDSLLNDLTGPEYQESVTALNLSELVAFMQQSQTEFADLFRDAAETEAKKEPVVAATKLKREARRILVRISNYMNAMQDANPEVYGNLAAEIANFVNSLNQKIRTRNSN